MAKQTELARKVAQLDAEIARLTSIRDYLTQAPPEPAEKPKRVRKRAAKDVAAAKEGIF